MNISSPGPFENDVLETRPNKDTKNNPVLSEKDFIQEPPRGNRGGLPLWIWFFLLTLAGALLWGSVDWSKFSLQGQMTSKPFLNVTNREFSLFLWQFSAFMRAEADNKTGYLPGFQYMEKETMYTNQTEERVIAPPELLFLYHTWHRLLEPDFIARPIPSAEFLAFLNEVEEWKPEFWPKAPPEYVKFVRNFPSNQDRDLQTLPQAVFPMEVRRAFQGWKNLTKEARQINQLRPTVKEVQDFLSKHPTYARNFWRNIQDILNKKVAGPNYLLTLNSAFLNPDEAFPLDQLALFTRMAIFNYQQSLKGQ